MRSSRQSPSGKRRPSPTAPSGRLVSRFRQRSPSTLRRQSKMPSLGAILLAFFLTPLALAAQETTFHVDVKLVNIFVNVTDHNGAIVGALTKDDFAVFEDGRPQ